MADTPSDPSVEEILAEFERTQERRPADEKAAELMRRKDWLGEFEERRERVLRVELEELAWQVEQRGHHAWIQDVPATKGSGDVTGIELKVLPVADRRTASQAPGLQLIPDPEHSRVIAQVHDLEPNAHNAHVVAFAELDRIDAQAVRTLGTRLLDIVLLRTERVLEEQQGAHAGDWAPEKGGIVPVRGQSSDWLG